MKVKTVESGIRITALAWLLLGALLFLFAERGHAQGVRYDWTPLTTTTTTNGSNVLITPISNGVIHWCSAPANATPCTNFATTYTDSTLVTSCSTSTPVVLQGTTTCVAGADTVGNGGVWVRPGQYAYTVTSGSTNSGPFNVTVGPGQSGSVTTLSNLFNSPFVDELNSAGRSGSDVGGWLNSAYSGLSVRGGLTFLAPKANGLSHDFSTPVTFTTLNKYPIVQGLGPAGGGDTSNPGSSTINYTPTTATSAMQLDWTKFPTADTNPGAGLRDFGLTNAHCITFAAATGSGGCGSLAIGLDIGAINGGAQFGEFRNILVNGFNIGEKINGAGQSWGMQHYNPVYKYNGTGMSISSAEETINVFGGVFLGNGQAVNAAGTYKSFGTQYDSNSVGGFNCTGTAGTSALVVPHFENLSLTGAPNYLSGPCNILIFGGDALDDVAVGTTGTLLGTTTGALWIDGMALSSAGRTYSTGVVGVSGAAHLGFIVSSAAGVSQPCPAFGTSSNCEVIDPANSGGLGVAYFNTPNLGLNTTANPLHLKASNGSGGNTITLTATGSSTVTVPTNNGTIAETNFAQSWSAAQNFPSNKAVLTADWTCGTAGTVSSCVAATIIGSGGGIPLTFTLPLVAASYKMECDLVVGQATAATANNWNLLTATNGASNVTVFYDMFTAAAVKAAGATTDQTSTTTTFNIGGTWTLGGTATKMPVHIYAAIEGASASGTVVSLQLVAPTVGDVVTIYRGSSCSIY